MNIQELTDEEVIKEIKEYFCVEEFVDERTFKKYGEKAWQFIDIRLLKTILIIRINLDKGITANNWKWGGIFDELGLRTNVCDIVSKKTKSDRLYLSAHLQGKGLDFDVKGMTASKVRIWIKENAFLFPYKIRLEYKFARSGKEISWVHLDVYSFEGNEDVYLFNV